MSTVTKCTCGHEISQHTYSGDYTGCDIFKCDCTLDLGELIDKYAKEVADRTEQNLKDAKHIAELENFIRTRNVVCTWCGYTVVYDNENEEEKQAARDKVNAHSLVCEKDPRTIELKQVEANYDALQSPMPCGHLARYAVNGEGGTQYCVMCDRNALMEAGKKALETIENRNNLFEQACLFLAYSGYGASAEKFIDLPTDIQKFILNMFNLEVRP